MTDSVVVEGHVKLRDGKKWKNRWLVLRKPSPVADCLVMLVYKDKSERAKGHKERSSVTLEDICGLDPGLSYEGLNHTLAIICLSQVVMLGFDNKETMYAWDVRIRYSLGEVHKFNVAVAPGTKLESGPATLHFCNDILVLVKDLPPTVMGQWKLSDLRRYGAVPNGFIFEGGTRCGFWAGVFFLSCAEGEQISFLFDCIVRGISPTKGPFGLRPVLPGQWSSKWGVYTPVDARDPGAATNPAQKTAEFVVYFCSAEMPPKESRNFLFGGHPLELRLEAEAEKGAAKQKL